MSPWNTRTGDVIEAMVLLALMHGGYAFKSQVNIGLRFGGGRDFVDVPAMDAAGMQYLISLKWQQTSGTAKQKVPYEAMCLAEAVCTSAIPTRAYIVLGGTG